MQSKYLPAAMALVVVTAGCTTMDAQIKSGGELSQVDRDYATTAYKLAQLDDQEGKLAATKAVDPRVQTLSSQVQTQANTLYPGLQAAMKAEGVTPPNRLPPDVTSEIDHLRSLNGPAFDKQYIADQLAAHQQALQVFQQEDAKTKDSALRTQVETEMPALQTDLAAFQALASGNSTG